MTEQESQIETVNDELTELETEFSTLTRKKIRLLEKKIAALDELLRERDRAIEEVRVLRGLVAGSPQTAKVEELELAPTNVMPGEFADMHVWRGVEAVLRRERRPLTTREIVDRLEAGGKRLNAENPTSHVHASIKTKTDVFSSALDSGKRKWRLREWESKDGVDKG